MLNDCCGCGKNELNLCKLHAEKAKIDCLCVTNIKGGTLNVMDEIANNICAQNIQSKKVESEMLNANSLCSQSGVINDLCVNNLTAGVINYCEKYRASVTSSGPFSYTLGTPIQWDTIVDDPNNNISFGPFSYTVPVSGYYVFTFNLKSSNLAGSNVITGIPVGLLTILVNGLSLREQQAPYLAFSNLQKANITAIVILNAGDIVTMTYNTIVLDAVSGLINYVGTADLDGSSPDRSGFSIHYLSSLNCQTITCQPCPPVIVPCTPITVNCHESSDMQCIPLNSSMASQCKPCNPCFPGSK